MAIVSKTTRCAVCGSTDVTFSEATKHYHCASCGADEAHAMNAADVAAINSIAALGDTEGKLDELRRRFGNTCIQRGTELLDESLLELDVKRDNVVHPVGYF